MKRVLALGCALALAGCGGGGQDGALTRLLASVTTTTVDTTTFAGARNQYTIARNGGTVTVTDNFGSEGTRTFTNGATLTFADVTVNLAIADNATLMPAAELSTLIELYVAFFNRVPDADGLNYWMGQYRAGQSLVAIANAFYGAGVANSATTGYTATMTNADFINLVYRNVLGRADGADAGGMSYWSAKLQSGAETRGSLVIAILGAAHGYKGDATYGYVADLLDNKIAVSKALAIEAGINYRNDPITKGIAIAAEITSTSTAAARSVAGINAVKVGGSSVPAMNSVAAKAAISTGQTVVVQGSSGAAAVSSPTGLTAAPGGTNVKLWLYDPRATGTAMATGIFLRNVTSNGAWSFVGTNVDGSLYLTLGTADYEFDTTEPSGMSTTFARHRYKINVAANGSATVTDVTADARGYYAVTLDINTPVAPAIQAKRDALTALANEPASTFKPTSECQLIDQVTANRSLNVDIAVAFPKVRTRMPSYGRIRTLLVPLDFDDMPGKDATVSYYTPTVEATRDFYLKQSYGRVTLDFEIVPNWIRLPFSSTKYYINQGASDDSYAYRQMVMQLLDPVIDLGAYDAVVTVVPKEMPYPRFGRGPAITSPNYVRSGFITNGAMGGSDMYYVESGGLAGAQWKWMSHELGHAFGMVDLYGSGAVNWPTWSIMANNWSDRSIEHYGWDRFVQGWLDEGQYACLPTRVLASAGTTLKLSPIERQNGATKIAMVPVSARKVVVLESRRNEGYDKLAANREGVLVYVVDAATKTLTGGYQVIRRPGSTLATFEDAALHVGDTITAEGVSITFVSTDANGDTVKISPPK